MSKKEILILIGIALLFLALRLPGVGLPLHQDEYKWPMIVNPAITEPGGIPHPPVGEFIYRTAGETIGYDNFRFVPLVFSFVNLFLLFYLSRMIFGTRASLWAAGLFAVTFYSVLAGLMVDTDGAVMPMFFLIMAIAYYKLRKKELSIKNYELRNWIWMFIFIVSAVLGFLTKVSFVLAIAAIALDFTIEKEAFSDKKRFLKYLGFGILGLVLLSLVLYISSFAFSFFNLESAFKYWRHFANFSNRGWFQTFIQFVKVTFYLSPLLVVVPFLADKEVFRKTRLFCIYAIIGLIFYLLLFDFSIGALDRYLQFLVVPLCVIAGAVIAKYLNYELRIMDYAKNLAMIIPVLISISIFFLQFFNHSVPSLHPKSEWIGRIFSLKWNFLYPFSGGSGPLGFYVSFALVGLFWIFGLILFLTYLRKRNLKEKVLLGFLAIGLFYNTAFTQEYLFGKINGYAPALISNTADFIRENPDIKKVVVYNDNGGNEIMKTGKYEKRLYTSPQFNQREKADTINNFSGHYLVVDIPKIDPESIYAKYFASCKPIYKEESGSISAVIYDCRGAPPIKF